MYNLKFIDLLIILCVVRKQRNISFHTQFKFCFLQICSILIRLYYKSNNNNNNNNLQRKWICSLVKHLVVKSRKVSLNTIQLSIHRTYLKQ